MVTGPVISVLSPVSWRIVTSIELVDANVLIHPG